MLTIGTGRAQRDICSSVTAILSEILMDRYFFDVTDGERHDHDPDGLEFGTLSAARRAAVCGMADMVREALPDSTRRRFIIRVRNTAGEHVLKCTVNFDVSPGLGELSGH
ncbi:conserved hypothetical protein [Rhizobium sp. EC-SD404]|nr:conserved hypothetical protein [Rhizobium sp. EC-SD404]